MTMKFFLFISVCVTNVIAQSYIYNAYESSFVDERDGNIYHIFETDSSKWFVEDLQYIPKASVWTNVRNGELYCESNLNLESIATDESDFYLNNLQKTLIEDCRKVYYKWDLAITSCPRGWHLAKTEEWVELAAFLERNPFLQNVVFFDHPKYYVNYYYGKEKNKFVLYDNFSMWWRADLDVTWKKNTRANVTHFRYKKIEIKKNSQRGSVFWTNNSTKSWKLLPARCVENKQGFDYSIYIPPIDTSSSIKYGHGVKAKSNKVSELRLDQLM